MPSLLQQSKADGRGQVRLAATRRAKQGQVGAMAQPAVAGAQRRDLGLGDQRYRAEVKVPQRLGFAQVALDTPKIAPGELVLGQGREQVRCGPGLLVGALGEGRLDLLERGQPQLAQQQRQPRGGEVVAHACTSWWRWTKASQLLSEVSCTQTSDRPARFGAKRARSSLRSDSRRSSRRCCSSWSSCASQVRLCARLSSSNIVLQAHAGAAVRTAD